MSAESTELRADREEALQVARVGLRDAGYEAAALRGALDLDDESGYRTLTIARVDESGLGPAQRLLARLLLLETREAEAPVERVLGSALLGALRELRVLVDGPGAGEVAAAVKLYPVGEHLLASDVGAAPDPESAVFPAYYEGTIRFLRFLPREAAGDGLDLGTGTGVAALALRDTCSRVLATDVNPRACRFARFNVALNGVSRVDVACGDLDAPAGERDFDVVVAHPPYVPALERQATWRDAGSTGEELVRRVVEALPARLRRGGWACVQGMGLDTREAPYEQRARAWLGAAGSEFDVLFVAEASDSPERSLSVLTRRSPPMAMEDVERLVRGLEALGVTSLSRGALLVRRRTAPAPPITLRRHPGPRTGWKEAAAVLDWHGWSRRDGAARAFLGARPRLSPALALEVTHGVRDGRLVPVQHRVQVEHPFVSRDALDPSVVPVLERCSGQATVAELFKDARAAGAIPEGVDELAFGALLGALVERGILVLDETPRV